MLGNGKHDHVIRHLSHSVHLSLIQAVKHLFHNITLTTQPTTNTHGMKMCRRSYETDVKACDCGVSGPEPEIGIRISSAAPRTTPPPDNICLTHHHYGPLRWYITCVPNMHFFHTLLPSQVRHLPSCDHDCTAATSGSHHRFRPRRVDSRTLSRETQHTIPHL
jgi:hypothetical protein